MNAPNSRKPGSIDGMRQNIGRSLRPVGAWWAMRTARERRLLRMGAIILGAAMVWVVGLKPAMDSIARSRERLPRLQADAMQVNALILEAQALQRRLPGRLEPAAIPGALRESLRRAGLEASARVNAAGAPGSPGDTPGTWEIELHDAGADRVMQWLDGLPGQLNVRISSATLNRSRVEGQDRPGRVTGAISLQAAAAGVP